MCLCESTKHAEKQAGGEDLNKTYRRGDIYYAQLSPIVGSEQEGLRPVIILQNDIGNRYSPTTIIAPISSKSEAKAKLPTHFFLRNVLEVPSVILLEQIRTVDKQRLREYVGTLDEDFMREINKHILISLGIEAEQLFDG